jgi:hypothetical protein
LFLFGDTVAARRREAVTISRESLRGFVLVLAACVLSSCAARKELPPYVLGSSGAPIARGSEGGVTISAEVVTNTQILKSYFAVSSRPQGMLPVFLKVENADQDRSLLLEKDEIRLNSGSIDQGGSGNPLANTNTKNGGAAAGAVEGSIVGSTVGSARRVLAHGVAAGAAAGVATGVITAPFAVLTALEAARAAKAETEYDFVKWELRTSTLSPGQVSEGFVYFNCEGDSIPTNSVLAVPLHDLAKQTVTVVRIPVSQ